MRWKAGALTAVVFLLSGILAGCRQAERIAWAADARNSGAVGWPSMPPPPAQTGLADYLAGLLAEGRGDLDAAKAYYLSASQNNPRNAEIHLRLGMIHLQNDEMPEAIRALESAAKNSAEDPRARFVLGVLYTDQGRLEEAARQYSLVLAQDPKNLAALSHLADLYLSQEKIREALDVYERLLEERPDSSAAHFDAGVLYARVGEWASAVEHMAAAVELDPRFLEARLGLAVGLEQAGRLEQAREQFSVALAQEPVNTQLIHYLAKISYRMGDLKEAGRWLTRYLSFKPREAAAHIELAYVRIDQGRWQEAAQQVQSVMDPQSPLAGQSELWTVLGMAYQTGGKLSEAEQAYRQAIQLDPEAIQPVLQMGNLFQRLGRFEEAERLLHDAFVRQPDDPDLLNSLGFLYADQGIHLEEAVDLLERALRQDPGNGAYMDSLGWAYFKLGRPEDALNLLEQAAIRFPDPEVFDHLGQVYLSVGREREALSVWKKGLQLEAKDPQITERLESYIRMLSRKQGRER